MLPDIPREKQLGILRTMLMIRRVEIIGRAAGYCQGRAGTFHVAAPDVGIVHTSAIVGGCLALAAGTAYAAQVKASQALTVVFSATAPWKKACSTRS